MSVCTSLTGSIQDYVMRIVLDKGLPVLPEGEVAYPNEYLTCSDQRWNDAAVQQHIKGGWKLDEETKHWVEVPACGWNTQGALTNDSMETTNGKLTLEVSGLTCNCGLYWNKVVRYRAEPQKLMNSVASAIKKHALEFIADTAVAVKSDIETAA